MWSPFVPGNSFSNIFRTISGAAQWIWSKNNVGATTPSNEIWCRGVRGMDALVWRGHQYYVEKVKQSWEGAELQCQSLGPTCHLAR